MRMRYFGLILCNGIQNYRLLQTNFGLKASYLQSNALLWFENYLTSNNVCEADLNWSEFKEQFLTGFQPVMATQQAHSRIMRWKQTSDIEQYINGFLNLSAQVPINFVGELGLIAFFIENLKDVRTTVYLLVYLDLKCLCLRHFEVLLSAKYLRSFVGFIHSVYSLPFSVFFPFFFSLFGRLI